MADISTLSFELGSELQGLPCGHLRLEARFSWVRCQLLSAELRNPVMGDNGEAGSRAKPIGVDVAYALLGYPTMDQLFRIAQLAEQAAEPQLQAGAT